MIRTLQATIRGGVAVSDAIAELPDGTEVIVVAPDDGDLALAPDDIAELAAANGEADRGEVVSAEDVLRRLDARHAARQAKRAS